MNAKLLIVLILIILTILFVKAKYGPFYYVGIYNMFPLPPGIEVKKDIKYGENERLKLDVYYPRVEVKEEKPVVIFVHGGSWKSNSKDQFRFIGKNLAKRGYIAVLPNYRLVPDYRYPAQIKDVAKAFKWTENNINSFGGTSNNIILSGHSAGGHLAALLGYSDYWQEKYNISKKNIDYLVLLAGVYKFADNYEEGSEVVKDFVPIKYWEEAQPALQLDYSDPSTFILQGLQDETVSPKQADYLAKIMQKKDIKHKKILKEDLNHISLLFSFANRNHQIWNEIKFDKNIKTD